MTNEEMSMRTKRALAESLKAAMNRKSLSKITVSELIADCNINRKTFYYHFENIYDLLKWTLEQEAVDVIRHFDLLTDTEEAIRFVMNYTDDNRHIITVALDSMGYEELRRFFYQDFLAVVEKAIAQGEEKLGVQVEPQFRSFIAVFYTEASAGLLIEWIRDRQQDREKLVQNLLAIYRISIPALLSGMTVGKVTPAAIESAASD